LLTAIAFFSLVLPCAAQVTSKSLTPMAPIPAGAQFDTAGHLDVQQATRAYLKEIPADKKEASDKYFEGGYWLVLWDALYSIAVLLLLLFSGVSVKMRNLAERVTRFRWIHVWIYFAQFSVVTFVLGLPLTIYEGFYREHIYQQSHQPFAGWMRDQMVSLAVGVVLGGVLVAVLYWVVRRAPRTWHLWATAVFIVFVAFAALIGPVYLAPLFNTYQPVQNPAVTVPVLKMAHANGIPVDKLVEVDASKQTTNVSANVSGLFGTTRITLNDNLLNTSSLSEIEAVTGHEMGHYVLHHVLKSLFPSALLFFVFFSLLRWWLESMQRRRGQRWGTRGIDDVALLPAALLAITVLMLLATPITNTMTRSQEAEADMYGINASRQPDGFAMSMLKLGQYRKMEPGPVEEFIFFDHPSGRTRITEAMQWKAQNFQTVKECEGY
jgi:STE24 endopeptidase